MAKMKEANQEKKTVSRKTSTKYKKAPNAPKRFKSAFIIFSAEKHKAIKKQLSDEGRAKKTTDIAKLVSEAWKELSPDAREEWETKANEDKARYEAEKARYNGPWKVPANVRTPKDPTAPKRPMSAFLAFSNSRRAALKREHPDATNADLSKMLSKTWKELLPELKEKYMKEEAALREKYKADMAVWRKNAAVTGQAQRKQSEALALLQTAPSPIRQDDLGQDAALMGLTGVASLQKQQLASEAANLQAQAASGASVSMTESPFLRGTANFDGNNNAINEELKVLAMRNKLAALQQTQSLDAVSRQQQAEAANLSYQQAAAAFKKQQLQNFATSMDTQRSTGFSDFGGLNALQHQGGLNAFQQQGGLNALQQQGGMNALQQQGGLHTLQQQGGLHALQQRQQAAEEALRQQRLAELSLKQQQLAQGIGSGPSSLFNNPYLQSTSFSPLDNTNAQFGFDRGL